MSRLTTVGESSAALSKELSDFLIELSETNAWYKEHKAGASYTPGGAMPPALRVESTSTQ